jgi:hypothetical protein
MIEHCRLIPLTIYQDWTEIKNLSFRLISLLSNVKTIETYGNSQHYMLGSIGTISQHNLSENWYRITGPVINKTMPWLNNMLETFKGLCPDDGCISYLKGNGGEHVDLPTMQTALNYIFDNTDKQAYTWINHNNNVETYPSPIGDTWLLNTQMPHGISNQGERWTLSIHFNTEYSKVCQWFESHTNLVFGENNI